MEIILIRHAKAEDRRENLEDIKRQLTEKGKKKFRKLMPELNEKLEPIEKRKMILWSSPANRALETAQIVAEALQMEISSIHNFIYEGNFEKLTSEVQNVDVNTTLVIVGHEPSMSVWTKYMTQEDLRIRKGDMLNLKITNQTSMEAELQWVISSK